VATIFFTVALRRAAPNTQLKSQSDHNRDYLTLIVAVLAQTCDLALLHCLQVFPLAPAYYTYYILHYFKVMEMVGDVLPCSLCEYVA